jgi:hypothetical protein
MIWLAVSIGGVFLVGLLAWSLRMNRRPNDIDDDPWNGEEWG